MFRTRLFLVALSILLFTLLQWTVSEAAITPYSTKKPISINRSASLTSTLAAPPTSAVSNATSSSNITSEKLINSITCPCTNMSVTNDVEVKLKDNPNNILSEVISEKIKQTVQQGILRFSLRFQNILSNSTDKSKNNVLFSPVNILAGLATLLLGSEAEAKDEILNLLEFYAGKDLTNKEQIVHEILAGLFANFSGEGDHNPAVKIKMNQSIFYQNDTVLKEDFVKSAKQFYNNELIKLNFSRGDNGAVTAINEWVSNRTEKRITEILKPPLPLDTKLILLNTLFFNGEWDEPFFANSTEHDFFIEKTPPIKVKTMSNSGIIYSYENSTYNFSVIGLPYKGGETVMYIILPDKGQKLNNVLAKISAQDLYDIMNSTERETEASYTLPYMSLTDNVGLKSMLEKLGVRNIFDPVKANLSKIAENIGLYVSEALHNVNLDVTEAGSTGAASTAMIIETKFPSKKIVLVNKPFSFFIIHRPSGVISFWGTIYDPRYRI